MVLQHIFYIQSLDFCLQFNLLPFSYAKHLNTWMGTKCLDNNCIDLIPVQLHRGTKVFILSMLPHQFKTSDPNTQNKEKIRGEKFVFIVYFYAVMTDMKTEYVLWIHWTLYILHIKGMDYYRSLQTRQRKFTEEALMSCVAVDLYMRIGKKASRYICICV